MSALRRLLAQRDLAVLLCLAVLWLKLLVPTGYMIDAGQGWFAVVPCSGMAVPSMPAMAHGAMAHHAPKDHHRQEQRASEMPCAFAGLSAPALSSTDPVQLAALIAFVLALGLSVVLLPAPAPALRLRPPLRGPPA